MKDLWEEVKEKCLDNASKCMEDGAFEEAERLLNMALGIHNAFVPGIQPVFIPEDSDGVYYDNGPGITCPTIQVQGNVFMDDSVLKKTPTCDLAKELETREAVQSLWIEPYTPFGIFKSGERVDLEIAEGAANILVIWD